MAPFILYFSIFGPLSEYNFSHNDQAWANFGGFIGGTIGPLLSAAACIVVFLTYKSQQEQLHLLKRQAEIDEIQRLVASTCQQIEQILTSHLKIGGMSLHLESAILMTRTDYSFLDNEGSEKVYYETIRISLLLRLHEFFSQLDMLEEAGGLPKIIKNYENKFTLLISSLNEIMPIIMPNIKKRYNLN